jgi:transposase
VPPAQVTKTEDVFPARCGCCARRLPRRPTGQPRIHQVIELPQVKGEVTQYNLHDVTCACGESTSAVLPPGVPPGMFGPRLLAFIGMLTGVYHVSRRDAAGLLGDAMGIDISLGALSEAEERVSEAVAAPVETAREYVCAQPVKHLDATGWKQGGRPRTLWTLASAMVTIFAVTLDATGPRLRGLFTKLFGILITDRGSQFGFWAMELRQICWAHLIRKFASFAEHQGNVGQLGDQLLFWARFLMHHWHRVRDGTMSRRTFRTLMHRARPYVEGLLENGVRLAVKGVSGSCADILAHRAALWTFVDTEGVEPTNNHAERELRRFVLWRKSSFGSQSDRGDRFAERIMTVAHTLRKQGRNVLSYLTEACQAALSGRTPPSLIATP